MNTSESTTNFLKAIADIISNYDISTILLIFSLLFFLLANVEKIPFISLNNNSKIKIANYLTGSVLLIVAIIIAVNKSSTPKPIDPSPVATNALDSEFKGVKEVYIQYNNDQNKADKLQKLLKSKNIKVPPMEKIKERIGKNSIKYSNKIDKENAERLKILLEKSLSIEFEIPVDLSESGYKIPNGRFEIWLKD